MLLGTLPVTGTGVPTEPKHRGTIEELTEDLKAKNQKIIGTLKEDPLSTHLAQQIEEDAKKGRMTPARLVTANDLLTTVMSPRFAVEQGMSYLPMHPWEHSRYCAYRCLQVWTVKEHRR